MTEHRDANTDNKIAALLGTPPVLCHRGFTQQVLLQIQRYQRRRSLLLGGTWLAALSGLIIALLRLNSENGVSIVTPELTELLGQIDLTLLTDIEHSVLTTFHNTSLLALAAALALAVIFAATSLLD